MAAYAQRVWGYLATGNYFDLLDVKPAIGRFFRADEDVTPGAAPYAVLSYAAWRPDLAAIQPFYVPEIWVPMMMQPHIEGNSWLEDPNTNNTCVLARARSGVTREQAEENLNAVGAVLGASLDGIVSRDSRSPCPG